MGVQRAKPSVCKRNRYSHFFTTSEAFTRSALCGVWIVKQSGGLFHKRGALCKRERPSEKMPAIPLKIELQASLIFLDYFLGLAAQDNWNRNTLEVVKTLPHRFRVQTKGFALLKPMTPLKRCQSQTFSSVFFDHVGVWAVFEKRQASKKYQSLRLVSRNSMFSLCAEQRKIRA